MQLILFVKLKGQAMLAKRVFSEAMERKTDKSGTLNTHWYMRFALYFKL